MIRRWLSAAAFVALCLAVTPAGAIQNGTPDGNGHPAVAWIIATNGTDICNLGQTFTVSSAVLVDDTVALMSGDTATALLGALGSQLDNIWVNFDANNPFDCTKYEHVGSVQVHPLFDPNNLNANNLGALILDATASVAPAALPVAGRLNGLPTSQPYTAVGYGFNKGQNVLALSRRAEPASFKTLGADVLSLRLDRGGNNAPCFTGFDDGGAAYVGSTTEIVGVNYDDGRGGGCEKVGTFIRLDTASARSFLTSLGVPVP